MRAVITVIGKDTVGILAKVSTVCAGVNANVLEVTQSVLQDFFCMVMLIDMTEMDKSVEVHDLEARLAGAVPDMEVHVMHENIFSSMHRI
jgi:ACT domain-containing protein